MNSINADRIEGNTGVWIVIALDTACDGSQSVKTQISFEKNKAIEIFENESCKRLKYIKDVLCEKYSVSESLAFRDIREEVLKCDDYLEMGYENNLEKLLTIHHKYKSKDCKYEVNDVFVKLYFIDESEMDKTFNKVLLKNINSVDEFYNYKIK